MLSCIQTILLTIAASDKRFRLLRDKRKFVYTKLFNTCFSLLVNAVHLLNLLINIKEKNRQIL